MFGQCRLGKYTEILNKSVNRLEVVGNVHGTWYSVFKNVRSSEAHIELL